MGLASLAEIFHLSLDRMTRDLVTSQAINWGNDPFARGAYSYATPKTREAQSALRKPGGGAVFFSGEALCRDMGTVGAALASGREAAHPDRRTIGDTVSFHHGPDNGIGQEPVERRFAMTIHRWQFVAMHQFGRYCHPQDGVGLQ